MTLDDLRGAVAGLKPVVWVGLGLAVLQQLVGINVIFYYSNQLWQSVGFQESDAFTISTITSVTNVVVTLVAIALVDKIGRKKLLLIAFLVATVQGSDVLQYIFGKLFGKHRIAPGISPSKTWEGFVGGVAAASLLGAGLAWLTPFSPVQAGALAATSCIMGFFGGLVA